MIPYPPLNAPGASQLLEDLLRPFAQVNPSLGDIKDNPSETSRLLLCLGLLYEYQEDFVLALFLYIKLSDPKAFELISK